MPKWLLAVLIALAWFGAIEVLGLLHLAVGWPGSRTCIAYDLMSAPSPSGRFNVAVENISCESPNTWETQATLHDTQSDTVVIALTAPATQESEGTFSTSQIQIKWLSESRLQISYPRGTRVKQKADGLNGVAINYVETPIHAF